MCVALGIKQYLESKNNQVAFLCVYVGYRLLIYICLVPEQCMYCKHHRNIPTARLASEWAAQMERKSHPSEDSPLYRSYFTGHTQSKPAAACTPAVT